MQKLYLDCDGVILNTIETTYQIIKERNITDEKEIDEFFRSISWKKLIIESGEIDNSISKIKELCKYFDVEILTHIQSNQEVIAKKEYFSKVLPNVQVNFVPKNIRKADFIDPNGAILVDDYLPNLDYWYENGGVPVKFSNSGKKCQYTVITDLLELIPTDAKLKIKL